MPAKKPTAGVLAILQAFRDSEYCDGDPSRPMVLPHAWRLADELTETYRAGFATLRGPMTGPTQIKLTDSGLALFRRTFPDHPYSLDCIASEREATSRRSYLLNIVVHEIQGGSHSPHTAAEKFARDHFEGHHRTVESLAGDWSKADSEWSFSGVVTLAEDDIYRQSRYRIAFNRITQTWEFRAPLD